MQWLCVAQCGAAVLEVGGFGGCIFMVLHLSSGFALCSILNKCSLEISFPKRSFLQDFGFVGSP